MQTFTTTDKRVWTIDLRHRHRQAVIEATGGLDLYHLFTDKLKPMQELLDDPPLLATVVYAVMTGPGEKPTEEAFADVIDGETMTGMALALVQALAPFCPNKTIRKLLPELVAKTTAVSQLLETETLEKLAQLTPEQIAAAAITTSAAQTSAG